MSLTKRFPFSQLWIVLYSILHELFPKVCEIYERQAFSATLLRLQRLIIRFVELCFKEKKHQTNNNNNNLADNRARLDTKRKYCVTVLGECDVSSADGIMWCH